MAIHRRALLQGAAGLGLAAATFRPARAALPRVKIAVLADFSGIYTDMMGVPGVECARQAVIDFAPHAIESLRDQHQHRRLGFSDEEMERWLSEAGLQLEPAVDLPPTRSGGLTVKIWSASEPALHTATVTERSAA